MSETEFAEQNKDFRKLIEVLNSLNPEKREIVLSMLKGCVHMVHAFMVLTHRELHDLNEALTEGIQNAQNSPSP